MRIFGRKYGPRDGISADDLNKKTEALNAVSNFWVQPPLFMRQYGTGFLLGVDVPTPEKLQFLVRITEVSVSTSEPVLQSSVQYKITAVSAVDLDPALWYTPAYNRPYHSSEASTGRIWPCEVGDLAILFRTFENNEVVDRLMVLDEHFATRPCSSKLAAREGTESVGSSAFWNHDFTVLPLTNLNDFTTSFDARLADYVAVSARITDTSLSLAWGGSITIQTSPDGRIWQTAEDAVVTLNADGYVTIDCRKAIGYVRASVTSAVSGKEIEISFSGKSSQSEPTS